MGGNANLTINMCKAKDRISDLLKQINQFCHNLLQGMSGGVTYMKNYLHAMLFEIHKFRIELSDGIGRRNNDVSFDWYFHRRKLAHSSVINLSGISIEGVQKLEWQVSSKIQPRNSLEEKLSVLKDRMGLEKSKVWGVK